MDLLWHISFPWWHLVVRSVVVFVGVMFLLRIGGKRQVGQLNMAQSKPAPSETAPAKLMTQIDRMDIAHVHWTTTTTDAQGQKDIETFDNPGNGEFYSLNGYTMVSHKLSPSMVQSTYREDSGQTDVLSCTLVNNARQMTCNGVITHQDGSTVRYTDVFDRV